MCQAKPGPRCANHTGTELKTAMKEAVNNPEADKSQLVQAQVEYYMTKTGRKELDEKIAAKQEVLKQYAPNDTSPEATQDRKNFSRMWSLSETAKEKKNDVDNLVTVDKALKSGKTLKELKDEGVDIKSAARSPRMNDNLAQKFAENASLSHMTDYMVATNPHVSPKILDKIQETGSLLGQRSVSVNPSLSKSARENILSSSDTKLKARLATNPNLSDKHKQELLDQNYPSVNKALATRKYNSDEVKDILETRTY